MWIRSRTRTSRAAAYTLGPAVPISTVHACGAGWLFRAACSRAASPPSDGAGAAAGARLTTSTSRRRAADQEAEKPAGKKLARSAGPSLEDERAAATVRPPHRRMGDL